MEGGGVDSVKAARSVPLFGFYDFLNHVFLQLLLPVPCQRKGTCLQVDKNSTYGLWGRKGLKQYGFIVFLLECSAVATFIFCVIPETKNKTFLEIKREFHMLNFRRAKEPDEESHEGQQLCLEV